MRLQSVVAFFVSSVRSSWDDRIMGGSVCGAASVLNRFERLRRKEGTVAVGALLFLESAEGTRVDAVDVSRARTRFQHAG